RNWPGAVLSWLPIGVWLGPWGANKNAGQVRLFHFEGCQPLYGKSSPASSLAAARAPITDLLVWDVGEQE
ncbi:MAG TPA: hypothetical protein VN833_13390, partial [Candidatus Acidoferrales bacterium]|nr:hypothetical protein [Candidatus Acidoferrales bacterium]